MYVIMQHAQTVSSGLTAVIKPRCDRFINGCTALNTFNSQTVHMGLINAPLLSIFP